MSRKSELMNVRVSMVETFVKAMIKEVGPRAFVAGLNNACAHGAAFHEADYKLDDQDAMLNKWFAGIEAMREAATEIEKFN